MGRIYAKSMESYIQISKINDFLYCPASLYLHGMYDNFSQKTFHREPQVIGKINHASIDEKRYSTDTRFLVGTDVYSQKYGIMGKIDIYDSKTKTLIERKTRVKMIYDGYRYQLFAQYFCLTEMGFEVKKLVLRSLEDNKVYSVPVPKKKEIEEFEKLVNLIWNFDPEKLINHRCSRCRESIYGALSW